MGILKDLTKEYFGKTVRKEDEINIEGLDVDIVTFTDKNKKIHRRGYKPKDRGNLSQLLKRMIEVRGNEGDFNDIDASKIEDMSFLFEDKTTFNGDISGWNVSKVTDMNCMFSGAKSFNQKIGDWKFPNVKDMSGMFWGATSFNQDLSEWNLNRINKKDIFKNCPIKDEFKPKMK